MAPSGRGAGLPAVTEDDGGNLELSVRKKPVFKKKLIRVGQVAFSGATVTVNANASTASPENSFLLFRGQKKKWVRLRHPGEGQNRRVHRVNIKRAAKRRRRSRGGGGVEEERL